MTGKTMIYWGGTEFEREKPQTKYILT